MLPVPLRRCISAFTLDLIETISLAVIKNHHPQTEGTFTHAVPL